MGRFGLHSLYVMGPNGPIFFIKKKVWVHFGPRRRDCMGRFGLHSPYVVGPMDPYFSYRKKYGSIWARDVGTVWVALDYTVHTSWVHTFYIEKSMGRFGPTT